MTTKNKHNYINNNTLFISLENPEVENQPIGVSFPEVRPFKKRKYGKE